MKYYLEFVKRKEQDYKGMGLEVECQSIPRKGDFVSFEREGITKAEVYEIYRPLGFYEREGDFPSGFAEFMPYVKALIIKKRE